MQTLMEAAMQAHWERHLIDLAGNVPHPSTRPVYSYWAGDASLEKAYELCGQIAAHHSKSFYIASGLLPEEKRSAARALYAFCRTVDDIVDEGSIVGRDAELDYWRGVAQGILHPRPDDLVAQAWADTRNRYHIPSRYALQLIDGVARDITQTRYKNFDDLATYCYGVASTVGLMSMYIVGFKSNDALPYAIKLGVALQLTNILRDVGEDYRNGRVYLPKDELKAYGITERDLARGIVNDKWRAFMKFQIERTRALYAESEKGIRFLERDGQLAIGAASTFYQGILDAIEANDYDVFSKRANLSSWGKLSRIPGLWLKLTSL
ncbi:MAG: squalene/phytoene synthase family protein [Anaerolineales bacterium]|nr:squalene/phytoene synthase family protein [Anaerolineales bacterium]MCX7755475.1 squalene/phytoene synthase family protein [Anaerolineales bacterium]MDW8278275.1 squalene/phytoene synthase family protein [Anaerolineales bacterium]